MFNAKKNLLDELAAIRVLSSNGFPLLKGIRSPLLSAKNDGLDFVLELLKLLVGWESLKSEVTNFLAYNVPSIEAKIKVLLKSLIRENFYCNTDGTIPQKYIDDGFNVQIKTIDLFEVLKVDPQSETGQMIYLPGGLDSILYAAINQGPQNWEDILLVEYLLFGMVDGEQKNDIFNVKVHPSYANKTINLFLNDFIDRTDLFSVALVVNKIMDLMFGSISLKLGKTFAQIKREQEFQGYVKKIIDLPDETIDDSYFDFTRAEAKEINSQLEQKRTGVRNLVTCGNTPSKVPYENIVVLNGLLSAESEKIEVKKILDNQFEVFGKSVVNDVNPIDKHLGLLEFFKEYVRSITTAVVALVLSPKIILFFFIYFKIGGLAISYRDFKDFLLSNKAFLYKLVRETIMPLVLDFLLKLVLKEIKKIISQDQINKQIEEIRYYQIALTSLTGL